VYAHFGRSPIIIMQMNSSSFASACYIPLCDAACLPPTSTHASLHAPETKSAENTSIRPRNKRPKSDDARRQNVAWEALPALSSLFIYHTRRWHSPCAQGTFFLQKPLESAVVLFSSSKLKQKVRSTSFISAGPRYNSQQPASR
jgi:hypothetical protein